MKAVILLLSLLYFTGTSAVMTCYYGSWANYRPDRGTFDVENIDPNLCTHLIYAFAGLNETDYTIQVLDPDYDLVRTGYDRFTGLKSQNPSLVTTLAVGGWNEGSTKYSDMAADPAKRQTFIDSTMVLLKAHNFDGLDMDWEYPNQRGGVPADVQNFVTLLTELSVALKAEGMILTTAVGAGKSTVDASYDVPGISAVVDYIHLMTYDLHGSWDPYSHHHTILKEYSEDTGDNVYLNVEYALNYWLGKGAEPSKMVLGTGAYGRSFTLESTADLGMYAPSVGPGQSGGYTEEEGLMGFQEICEYQHDEEWDIIHEAGMNEPYAITRDVYWIGYDDPASIAVKGDFAKNMGIAGVMIWSIDTDDWDNYCGLTGERFPLINSLNDAFLGQDQSTRQRRNNQ